MAQKHEEFLSELNTLTHGQRIARMIQVGRLVGQQGGESEASRDVAELLASLRSGSVYERRLGLYACLGSRDSRPVAAAVEDQSYLIRNLAVHLAALVCDDAELAHLMETARPEQRLRLIRGLRGQKRLAPVDAFLDAAVSRGQQGWALLLPMGSAACVERHRRAFCAQANSQAWQRMAHAHPAFCAAMLTDLIGAADGYETQLFWHARGALPAIGDRAPDAALALVKTLVRRVPLSELHLDTLIRRRPNDMARLALESDSLRHFQFGRVAEKLEPRLLDALLQQYPASAADPQRWLNKLPRERRREAYKLCELAWRDSEGVLRIELIAQLPQDIRQAEARRNLDLAALGTRPVQRIAYAAFLPWEQMREAVDPLARHPDADVRAAAISAMIGAARFQPEQLGDVLSHLSARRNEQDPVRQVFLRALANLPPGRWKSEHLEGLSQLLRHALDAADASHATVGEVERIVVALLPFHLQWAAQWIANIASERGAISSYDLGQRLTEADVIALVPLLLPVLQSWQTRERETQIFAVAQILGRRLKVFDGLADILESLISNSAADWLSEQALRLLHEHRRDRSVDLIPKLVKQDPSWATRRTVYEYLNQNRQDLLAPCLGRVAHRGRFSTGETRFFLPLFRGLWRWTPTQQATLAMTVHEVAGDPRRDSPAILAAIRQLAALPDIQPTMLIELAGANEKRAAVRDAALRALGTLDAGQGVQTLLAALGDERSRIAIYALRRALLQMPPARSLEHLRNIPMTQVTVAKETIRLVGELRTQDAYRQLLSYDSLDLHRDVRAALLRALWLYLDHEESWQILHKAVASGDPGQADIASRIPADDLNPDGQLRLARLLAQLLAHPDPVIRLKLLGRLSVLPLSDRERALHPGIFAALVSPFPDESAAAASSLFATYAGRQAEVVGQTTARLLDNRRALQTLVDALSAVIQFDSAQLNPTARSVLSALTADPLTLSLQIQLAVFALPMAELSQFFISAAASRTLHADALAQAISALSQLSALRGAASVEPLEQHLAASPEENLRRLAFAALVASTEPNHMWTAAKLQKLHAYRKDPSPMVRAAAEFTFEAGPFAAPFQLRGRGIAQRYRF